VLPPPLSLFSSLLFDPPEAWSIGGTPSVPTLSGGHGAGAVKDAVGDRPVPSAVALKLSPGSVCPHRKVQVLL